MVDSRRVSLKLERLLNIVNLDSYVKPGRDGAPDTRRFTWEYPEKDYPLMCCEEYESPEADLAKAIPAFITVVRMMR